MPRTAFDPDAIMHSVHVDNCAAAYVALGEHPRRDAVARQAFNISNSRYETARQIGAVLAASYGLALTVTPSTEDVSAGAFPPLAHDWQRVSSDKLRRLTGWTERKAPFADGLRQYRIAHEA